MLWALVFKDLVQHARPMISFVVSAVALPLIFALIAGSGKDSSGYTGVVFGYLGISAPMFFGQWFIGQEKLKGTFKTLRLLPVSGAQIIGTKFLSGAMLCLVLINGVLILEPAACNLFGIAIALPPATLILWTNVTAIFLVATGISLFTVLDFRIATQAVVWTICGLMVGIGLAAKYIQGGSADAPARTAGIMVNDFRVILAAGVLLISSGLAMIRFAAGVFEMTDWSSLEEG